MWSAANKTDSRGFTLLEIIISLVILGFVGASIGSGLVYSVQLYRNSQAMDTVMPQVDAAFNVVRKIVQSAQKITRGNKNNGTAIVVSNMGQILKRENNQLTLDNKLLLDNVSKFDVSEISAFSSVSSEAKVQHVLITIDLADTQKNIEFDVYNSQFKEGASE